MHLEETQFLQLSKKDLDECFELPINLVTYVAS